MKFFENIKKSIIYYRPLSYYIIGTLCMLPVYTALKSNILDQNSNLINIYAGFLSKSAELLSGLLGHEGLVGQALKNGGLIIDTQLMALWQTLIFLIAVALLPFKKISVKIGIITGGLIFIVIFNIIRIVIFAFNNIIWHGFNDVLLNNILMLFLNFSFIYGLVIWFKNHYSLKKLLMERIKISSFRLKNTTQKVIIALVVLVIINFITNTQIIPFITYFVYGILKASEYLLTNLGYTAALVGERMIEGPNAAIYFSDSCLGIELMLTFAFFIAILEGKTIHKIWFITSGVIFIYILNILRITLIFIHLVKNQGNYTLAINYHDIYSYSVYIVVFILWVIWINNFNKSPQPITGNQQDPSSEHP